MKMIRLTASGLAAVGFLIVHAPIAMADVVAGKAIYDGKGACASCHGPLGKGDGAAAAALNPKPRDFSDGDFALDTDGDGQKGTDADLFNVIKDGAAKYGGAATMPGRADIPDAEIKALAAYVRSLQN